MIRQTMAVLLRQLDQLGGGKNASLSPMLHNLRNLGSKRVVQPGFTASPTAGSL